MQLEPIIPKNTTSTGQGRLVTELVTELVSPPEISASTTNPSTPKQNELSPEALLKIFPLICTKETSYSSKGWTKENPLYGQCTVVSLIAQSFFGGELLRASLKNSPDFKRMRYHYWNRLPDGREIDFTKDQFGDKYPKGLVSEVKRRKEVIRIPTVEKRYKELALNLVKHLNKNNPIFDAPVYQRCFFSALESPCQKMKFGCVIKRGDEIVYEGNNKTIGPLKDLCDPKCIRFLIQSRTEQMLGACGHAEELGLWEVAKKGIPLNECELYIAGTHSNGLPWLKKEPEHTCLRCTTQMYNAGIKKIYVPVNDRWVGLTKEEAIKTALAYATKEKTVCEVTK